MRERSYYGATAIESLFIAIIAVVLIAFLWWQNRSLKAFYDSQARFSVAFDQAAVGIARTSLDGRFLEVNPTLCVILGYSPDELLGRAFIDVTHPDDRANTKELMNHLLAANVNHASPTREKRYIRKDGSLVWVMVTAALVRDIRGHPDYFMSVIQDIMEREHTALLLTDSERRFRALIENAADAIVITDRNGVITFASPAVKSVAGYELREVVCRNFLEFIHPEDAQASRAMFEELLRDASKPRQAERRFRHKDGSWIDLETIAKNALGDPTIQGIVVNARDVTERKQTERTLFRVNRARNALGSCNGVLVRASDEKELLDGMCRNIVEFGGYRLTWVGLVEHDEQKTVRPVAYAGYEKGFIEQASVTWADTEYGRGPIGTAIRTRKAQIIQNAHTDSTYRLWQNNAVKLGYGSVTALPLLLSGDVLGALTIYSAEVNAFDEAEIQLLGELADDLAYGIATLRTRAAHEQSAARLLRSTEGTILAMAATLEIRDPYTAGHQRRVAELAVAIAGEMGLSKDKIHGLRLAAVVHDLGKIQIPAEILSKPGRLTDIEFELIKTHSIAGYNILKEVDFPWPIAQIVYQHHERLNGAGYPRGLKGHEILLEARILAVADTVEAMASHRPYRPSFGIDHALEEVTKNSDKTYDAAAAATCVKLFREKRFAFSV